MPEVQKSRYNILSLPGAQKSARTRKLLLHTNVSVLLNNTHGAAQLFEQGKNYTPRHNILAANN
ncbi:hypothetical protein C7N43_19210 [Sphingobacteriales bacterium UPWRP_1]|nr:hypothetical protein C7N43_19210 [Sphingobacteriales bacterium UPWRP_1]